MADLPSLNDLKGRMSGTQPTTPEAEPTGPSVGDLMSRGGFHPTQKGATGVTLPTKTGGELKLQGEIPFNFWGMNPETRQAMLTAALAEGLGMTVPPMAGAGAAALLPRLFARGNPIEWPGRLERITSMMRAAGGAGLGNEIAGAGKGTEVEPFTNVAALGADILTPMGLKGLGRALAPTVAEETARTARGAERAGFKLSPKQIKEEGALPQFHARNAILANRMLTGAADDVPVDKISRKWLDATDKKLDQAYEYIFSPQNIFALNTGLQDQVVNTVLGGAGKVPGADRFIAEAAGKVPFLVQPSVIPMQGGTLLANRNFIPFDGDQLRDARDMIRRLQRDGNSETRHYGNEIWEALMDNMQGVDPALHRELMRTNQRYRAFRAINEMDEAGAVKQGNVDLIWLDKHLRKGLGGEKYRMGRDPTALAQAGIIGKDLNVANQPQPFFSRAAENALMLGGGALGGAVPYAMGQKEISWPNVVAGGLGAVAAPKIAQMVSRPLSHATSRVGRLLQHLPAPQEEAMRRAGAIQRLYGQFREPGAAVLGDILNRGEDQGSR